MNKGLKSQKRPRSFEDPVGIAEQMRVGKSLQRSEEKSKKLAKENAIVGEIGRIISSTLNIEEVYEGFAEEVRKLIPFDRIVIDLNALERNTFTIAYVAGVEIPGRRAGDIFSLSGSDNEYLIGSQSGLLIQSEEESELALHYPILLPTYRAGFRSMMSVPLISKDQVIGGLHFRSFEPRAYTDLDLKLAARVGTQIAGAIANAQLFTEHKRIEEALAAERQRFQTLAEGAPIGMVLIDPDDQFIYINPKFKELFGYNLKEIPDGRTWFRKAYPNPDYRHQVIATWVQDLESSRLGERRPRTFTVTCKEGEEKIISFIPVQLATGEQLMTCEDITQHKQAEEALREGERFLANIFASIQDGLSILDKDLQILRVNPVMERWYDHVMPLVGKKCYEAYHGRSEPCTVCPTLHTIKTGEAAYEVVPKIRTPGEVVGWFDLYSYPLVDTTTGKMKGVIEYVRDITERKRAEEALKESEARYRSLFEGVPVGLYRTTHEGQMMDANQTFIQMLGYSDRESFMRMKAEELYIKPEDWTQWQTLLDQEGVLHHFEKQLRRCDGTPIWVEENARAYRGPDGQVLYYEGSLEDITKKKQATTEMLTLQEQLRQSQKMEAIGRLAGGIAHDFNNLLTVISGYSQLSLSTLQEGNPLRENVLEIQRATDRASALTRQLLAFGRRQILDMRLIDLNLIVQDLDKMLRRVIGEDIELVTLLDKDLWRIKSDPSQIEQAILNLAVNARDAMPKGGRLTIETSNTQLSQEYARSHVGVKSGSYVKLLIKDTGVGMSPEVAERAFEPFFTTKEKGKGTGLGLSTVYGIVKQSGGNIWVHSEFGRGTTFEIYLPRTGEIKELFKPVPRSLHRLQGSETILLVEDEEAVRVLARKTLRNYGYHTLEAANGEEVFNIVKGYDQKIHLLVTDVVMPGMSGREVADRLLLLYPEIKVLYISGYTDSAIVHHGILEPETALLLKPFKPDALAQKVREVLEGLSKRS